MCADEYKPQRNYVSNAWWVAGFADEFSRVPVRRLLLERAVVLYREENGQVVALADRCAHRWAPLSSGRIEGDDIVCPYHGFRYNGRGVCVHIPTQRAVPGRTKVRAYPTYESAPFVWIWMGDQPPTESRPPSLPWAGDPKWTSVRGSLPVKCNYMLIQENVLDLTHFPHLHATTLEQPGWSVPPAEVALEPGRIGYRHVFTEVKLAPWQSIPTGISPDRPVTRTDWGEFVSPAIHVAGIDIVDPAPVNGRADFASRIVHATTPESPDKTHYWWCISQDYALDDEVGKAAVKKIIDATFAQDKELLEAIQQTISQDWQHDRAPEVSIEADRQGLYARKMLKGLLEGESPPRND